MIEKKKIMEQKILEAAKKFEKETGLTVSEITAILEPATMNRATARTIRVETEVQLMT